MSSTGKKVAIIGGGVAGLLAAVTAADHGAKVLLFEKMDKVGLKMGITGKGRCNLTNNAPIMDFIAMTPGNGRFFSALISGLITWICSLFSIHGGWKQRWSGEGAYFPQAMMPRRSAIFLCAFYMKSRSMSI